MLGDGDRRNVDAYRAIVGAGGEPPMECIGTLRESAWAVQRLATDSRWSAHPVVVALAPEVHSVPGWDPLSERGPHCVPPAWMGALDALA